jgi:hypothetical protein
MVQLSFRWPGRTIVGFSTTVVFPRVRGRATDLADGTQCVPPFALDSGRHSIDDDWVEEEVLRSGVAPEHLPYANATASNAKIARDGQIIATPLNERPGGSGRRASLLGPPRGTIARPTYSPQSVRVRA